MEQCKYSEKLLRKIQALDNKKGLCFIKINKAIYWAKKYHEGQFRKSGEPFYSHPLEVAYMVSDYLLTTDAIVAAILHDIVEDTEVTVEIIADEFGWRAAEMVDRLTRDRPDGTKLSVETILQNAYAHKDKEVILIKLIDRIHNLRTINFKSSDKIAKTIQCSLNNFSSICLLLDDINIEQLFNDCFSAKRKLSLNSCTSAKEILSRALENA